MTKRRSLMIIVWFLFLAFTAQPNMYAQTVTERATIDLLQVTTHPDVDLSASISPDGKWMAYVSRQSGNLDVWVRNLARGISSQITVHTADDYYPVWYRDNKTLLFVSQRSDAAGDIWQVRLHEQQGVMRVKKEAERITHYQGYDGYPTLSPRDFRMAWVSDRSGSEEVWMMNVNGGTPQRVTWLGGTHPAWGPDQNLLAFTSFRDGPQSNGDIYLAYLGEAVETQNGPLANASEKYTIRQLTHGPSLDGFPGWTSDAQHVVFLRNSFDSNKDGILTPADRAVIWDAQIYESPLDSIPSAAPMRQITGQSFNMRLTEYAMPLTSGGERVTQPGVGANGRVYFTSARGGNSDIWSIPAIGYIPRESSAFTQYNYALSAFPLPAPMSRQTLGPMFLNWSTDRLTERQELALWDRQLAFQRVLDFYGTTSPVSAQAFYEIAVCYKLLGYTDIARQYIDILLQYYPDDLNLTAYADMLRLGLMAQSISNTQARLNLLLPALENILEKYAGVPEPHAAAMIQMGDLLFDAGQDARAFQAYEKVLEEHPNLHYHCAEAQLKIGDVFKRFATEEEVIQAWLQVVQNYPEQRIWTVPARDRILDLLVTAGNSKNEISQYREIVGQYSRFPMLAAAAQHRIGDVLYNSGDYLAAIQEYEMVKSLFGDLTDEVFAANMAKAEVLLRTRDYLRAFALLEQLEDEHKDARPDLARTAKTRLLKGLLNSADEFKAGREFSLALLRYKRAREMDINNLDAHRGYIECLYYLKRIDEAVMEYQSMVSDNPNNQIVLYSLGLTCSYKGTEKAELYNNPDALDRKMLQRSIDIINRSLAFDYTLVQPYLTLGLNYEMMEQAQARERAKPKPFLVKVWNTLTAPVVSLYKTVTFRGARDDRGYYELAIHELTKAIGLNDEAKDPGLEANLALNLANNYYNLGEYGFKKAYEFYHLKLQYDSTFASREHQALIFERMGHCALIVEDIEGGEKYLLRAIRLYIDLENESHILLNVNRLAILYQTGGLNEYAVDYYIRAAEIQERRNLQSALMRSYRSIAFNYLMLDEPADAIYYAKKALNILETGDLPKVKNKASRVKLGFLGLYLPIPFVDMNKMVPTAALDFTTDDEWALIYTILGDGYSQEKNYKQAISILEKKLELYNKDRSILSTIMNNMAYLYFLDGDYTNAWSYFNQSVGLCEKSDITRGVLVNSTNLARIVLSMNSAIRENQLDYEQVKDQFWEYYEHAAGRINLALELIREEEFRYARTKIQLYRYLADFSLIRHDNIDDLQSGVESTLQTFESAVYAQTYLQEALRISKTYGLTQEECAVLYDQGEMLYLVGNYDEAYTSLRDARRLAIRNAFYDQLWRIDTQLGDLLAVMPRDVKLKYAVQKDAYEYYIEAIEVMEAHPVNISGANAELLRNTYQKPYLRAIFYMIEKNDTRGALALSEQMRAKLYLDIVSRENISLRKERHKIFYGNARFLQKTIKELEISLLQKRNRFDIPYSEIVETQKELDSFKQEYENLLKNAREEVPELETLVRVQPVNYMQLQERIRSNEALLYVTVLDDKTLTWLISKSNVEFRQVDIGRNVMNRVAKTLCESLEAGHVNSSVMRRLVPLFGSLRYGNNDIDNLVMVPPLELILMPWSAVLHYQMPADFEKSFTVSTSITDYYYAFDNRKIKGKQVYFASRELDQNVFSVNGYQLHQPDPSTEDNSFAAQTYLGQSDIVFMQVESDWNRIDPARSRMGFRIPQSSSAVFSTVDLYGINLSAGLVQIGFDQMLPCKGYNQSFMAWSRAFGYAGTPSLLVSLWPIPIAEQENFIRIFFKYYSENSASRAIDMTRRELEEQGKTASIWGAYQLYGFGGMDQREERRYARVGFEALVRRGHSAFNLGEWEDAIRIYSRAFRMAEHRNDLESMKLLQQRILESAVNGGIWNKAVDIQLVQIQQAQAANDVTTEANGYSNLAYFYTQNGEYDKGVKAKSRFTELTEKYGLKELEAGSMRETGLIYERGGKYRKALDLFEQSRMKFQALGMELGEAQCLRDIGRVNFFYLDNYFDALQVQEQALERFRKHGVSADLVDALHNLGNTHEKMGNYKQAREYQQQALAFAIEMADQRLEGLSRQYLANVQWKMAAFQQALEQQTRALEIFNQLGDLKLLQVAYATRGLIALSFGNAKEALEFENKALDLAESRDDLVDKATILKNIGMVQRTQGNIDLALYNFKQAAQLDSTTGSKRGLAYDLRNIAAIRISEGITTETTRPLLDQALELSLSIQDWRNITQCYLELGLFERQENHTDSALVYLQKAADHASQFYMPDIQWRALKYLAETQNMKKQTARAIETYYQAIEVIEEMRSTIKVEEYASGFVDDKLDVYGALIDMHLEMDRPGKAFTLVERSKGRSFLDMLGSRDFSFSGENRELLARRDSLQSRIKELENRLFYYRSRQDSLLSNDFSFVENELEQTRQAYWEIQQSIRDMDPELFDMFSVQPITVDSVQSFIPDSTALLEYYLNNGYLYSWFITRDNIDVHKSVIGPDQFSSDIFELRSALDRQLSISQWSRSFYGHLIAPWKSRLGRVNHLVIVPHGPLHYLPFAVLSDNDQDYLGLEKSLSIAPSATVLGYCLKNGAQWQGIGPQSMSVAAFGNPDLGSRAWDLPFASREVNSLKRYYDQVNILLDRRASETNLYARSDYPPMMLFSCHGEYDDINPMHSALLLAPDSLNDGRLEAREIFGLNMDAYIVAMSACETGLGKVRGGDEVVGLSRSFIYAGASSLLSSLWKVDDLATAVLMKRFFRNLSEGHPRAEALRLAQNTVFNEVNPYPAFWGAFTLTGDFR